MDTPSEETPPAPKPKPKPKRSTILWLLLGLLALGIAGYLASDPGRWLEARDMWRGWQEGLALNFPEQKTEPAPKIAKPGATPAPAAMIAKPGATPAPASAPTPSPAPASSASTSKLEQQVRQLQAAMRQQRQQMDTLLQQQSRLQTRIGTDSPYARQAAMALGLLQLSIASANGTPFEAEHRVLASLLPDNPGVAALKNFAREGVAGETALLLRVPSLITEITVAPVPQEDVNLWAWLKSRITGLVRIRRLDASADEGHDAILARMELAAHNGDLESAFAAAKELQSTNTSLEYWMESTRRRLELRKNIKSLSRIIASETVEQ
ncbi:MAG: hypothetical protein OXF05_04305 [Hyphomicrobiales bacterium]|nr:hypothetical protein [Hyphomicrobiales bacterium]